MSITQKEGKIKGRCIALFPGAFRPPHQAHFSAVLKLVSRADIDELVVIITNRCRSVPGTTKVIDTDVAERVWSMYLQDIEKVRVEVASSSAVQHALGYFYRVNMEDNLLICVGEAGIKADGGSLARKIKCLKERTGISASLIAAPTWSLTGRATGVRANLGRGDAGRAEFMRALPNHLNSRQRKRVWQTCRQGMSEMSDIVKPKVRNLIENNDLGDIEDLTIAKSGKTDEVCRVKLKDGRCLFVKYANDTVSVANFREPLSLKPRDRLAAERRAIRWLRTDISSDLELPEVVYFDKKTKALVMTEVCPGGRLLQEDLKAGVFDPQVAVQASRFLAQCHHRAEPASALWGKLENDLDHWKTMLALRTIDIKADWISVQTRKNLEVLYRASEQAQSHRFVHLDYCPKNILLGDDKLGVIDLEMSTSVGDPACDFGFFIGHYILYGYCAPSGGAFEKVIQEAVAAYQHVVGNMWISIASRVVAFTGATILYRLSAKGKEWVNLDQTNRQLLAVVGAELLANGLGEVDEPEKLLMAQQFGQS